MQNPDSGGKKVPRDFDKELIELLTLVKSTVDPKLVCEILSVAEANVNKSAPLVSNRNSDGT